MRQEERDANREVWEVQCKTLNQWFISRAVLVVVQEKRGICVSADGAAQLCTLFWKYSDTAGMVHVPLCCL